MNTPLLYWATEQTGDERYAQAARRHTAQLRDTMIRPDGTTFHTFWWDVVTGVPLRGSTQQGLTDDSCWARGQAWGIYGFALAYRCTGDETFRAASVRCAVLTISDTRTEQTDTGGAAIVSLLEAAGHVVAEKRIVRDEPDAIRAWIVEQSTHVDVPILITTGGTGITSRDGTYEVATALIEKPLPGFGELFRMLSYEHIGPACMLSRAVGGLMGRTVVLVMPGSRAAVQLAMTRIILPELPHLVREARKG